MNSWSPSHLEVLHLITSFTLQLSPTGEFFLTVSNFFWTDATDGFGDFSHWTHVTAFINSLSLVEEQLIYVAVWMYIFVL